MEVRLPATLEDCSPEQLSKWLVLTRGAEIETFLQRLSFRVEVVAIFSNLSKDELRELPVDDLNNLFAHCLELLTDYELEEPEGRVEIDGKVYVFDKDFSHFTTGQIIDIKLIEDVYNSPYELLAQLYIEEGMKYNEVKDKKVVNPIENRIKVFKEGFSGREFLNVSTFFLTKLQQRKGAIYIWEMAQTKTVMERTKRDIEKEIAILNGSPGQKTSLRYPNALDGMSMK